MKNAIIFAILCIGVLLLSSCNLPGGEKTAATSTQALETLVARTLTAIGQEQPITPSETSIPASPTDTSEPSNTSTPTLTLEPTQTQTTASTMTQTLTQAPTNTPVPKPGTIEGTISGYPYGTLPRLAIVAYQQQAPYNWSYWITAAGTSSFSMTSSYLMPGKWLVVAYDPDGHKGGCPSVVTVKSEETVTCNITDWAGSYPAKPSGVPFP